jgi:cysteine desulfurase
MAIEDIALSSGSACSSGSVEPSYVLKACGIPDDLAIASVRFGLGRFTTEEEVDYAAAKVADVIAHLRKTHAGR